MSTFIEPLHIAFTKEFKGATEKSKPRWYYTFNCSECGKTTTKVKCSRFKWSCTSCSQQKPDKNNKFIEKCIAKYGDRYDYSKTVYTLCRAPVIITCRKHGDFTTQPRDFLATVEGCQKCARDSGNAKKTRSLEHYTKSLPDTVTVESYTKVGYHASVTLKCAIHGSFTTTFGGISKSRHVCAKCSYHTHQKQNIRNSCKTERFVRLYYFYIPSIDMYKFGLTTYKSSSLAGVEKVLLWEKWYPVVVGVELEHLVHTELSEFRYTGTKKLLRSGNTELYKLNVENKILEILNRASVQQCTVENILNGETPTSEDNPVLNQD